MDKSESFEDDLILYFQLSIPMCPTLIHKSSNTSVNKQAIISQFWTEKET